MVKMRVPELKEFHKYTDCDRKVYVFAQVTFNVLTLASLYNKKKYWSKFFAENSVDRKEGCGIK